MPLLPSHRTTAVKKVVCTDCDHASEAGKRAMSVFCPKCHKRIILENLKIRTYFAVTEFATSGDVVIERKGFVVAPIRADNVMVKGRVQGEIDARGRVTISKTGQIKGDVTALALVIEKGASLYGFLRIGLTPEPSGGESEP